MLLSLLTHAATRPPRTPQPESTVLLCTLAVVVRQQQLQHKHSWAQRAVRREHAVGAVAPHARRGTGQLRTHRHTRRERSVANPHTAGTTARAQAGHGLRQTWPGVGSGLRPGKGMPGTCAVNGSDGSSRGRPQWERSLSGWST